jgi:hypothetical protein
LVRVRIGHVDLKGFHLSSSSETQTSACPNPWASTLSQWAKIKAYANAKGVKLLGDMPIYVGGHSADVWCNRELWTLDDKGLSAAVSGVPPDAFSDDGQLWGSPLYDWAAHENVRVCFVCESVTESESALIVLTRFGGRAPHLCSGVGRPISRLGVDPTRCHREIRRYVGHARLPPGGVQGWLTWVHTPSRVDPPVGRHQLPQGSSTYLLAETRARTERLS